MGAAQPISFARLPVPPQTTKMRETTSNEGGCRIAPQGRASTLPMLRIREDGADPKFRPLHAG
jgi:hypothetical protein